jgi:hypothetical protein
MTVQWDSRSLCCTVRPHGTETSVPQPFNGKKRRPLKTASLPVQVSRERDPQDEPEADGGGHHQEEVREHPGHAQTGAARLRQSARESGGKFSHTKRRHSKSSLKKEIRT